MGDCEVAKFGEAAVRDEDLLVEQRTQRKEAVRIGNLVHHLRSVEGANFYGFINPRKNNEEWNSGRSSNL